MRVSVVSDIHGNIDGLARVAEHAEKLVVLGDLLDYVDYHNPRGGVLGRIFPPDKVARFIHLRLTGRFDELHAFNRSLWSGVSDARAVLDDIVARCYREVLAAIGPDALLILGNVDVAAVWNEVAGDVLCALDGRVVDVAGRRFGFVAGGASRMVGPLPPSASAWRPYMRPGDEYRAVATALPPVAVLCSHVPPNLPSLRYDVIPGRMEMYGPGLLEAIDAHQPDYALFGHVHQPLARRLRRGRTECVNVGHFQRFPHPFVLELE